MVVVGMAKSGIAALELLEQAHARVRAVDQNPAPLILNGRSLAVEPQTAEAFVGADLIVLSPGVPADALVVGEARQRGVPVIGDLELASWFLKGPIIGITGSNGKTTTTALTGHILKSAGIAAQVGGNIGTPPAAMVASSHAGQWNVLELSSFQLETTQTFHAHIGAVLNITPDHLDRHYTMENYAAAKARIFVNQTTADFAVLNADDPFCASYPAFGTGTVGKAAPLWFSATGERAPGAFLQNRAIILNNQRLMEANEVPLRGLHNLENTMAAAAISNLAGASHEQICAAVITFPGVEHRLEFVRELDGVSWYNDSKATNVDAALKAIAAFDGGLWVILGGKDKNSDYSALAASLQAKARGVLLIGAASEKIAAQLSPILTADLPLIRAVTLDVAISRAHAAAQSGDTVLLAPACASFDQFQNFEHRGREFKRLVHELKGTPWRG